MLCLSTVHSKSLVFTRLPATQGSVSTAKYFSGTNMESIIMLLKCPVSPKILNPGQRENAVGSTCFQSIKTSWSSRQVCRLKHMSAQNASQCRRSLTMFQDPDHTAQPNLQTLYPPNGSLRQKCPAPSSWEEHGEQHPGFPMKLWPLSPLWVPYISLIYFWMNFPVILLPTVNCKFPNLKGNIWFWPVWLCG